MDVRQLRYFVAVAEELHFGNAAKRLFMAQPPLSQQIRKLEEELGAVLFRRTSRAVNLTRAGKVLLARARVILESVEEAEQEVRAISLGHVGSLKIGFIHTGMETRFADAIRDFRHTHPAVAFDLLEMHSTDQLEGLRSDSLDVGLIRLVGQDLEGIAWEPFTSEPYVVALPETHVLCRRESLGLADLHREPFIFFYRYLHPRLHDSILARFKACGATPDIVMRGRTSSSILALVGVGAGIALVSRQMAEFPRKGIVFRPVTDTLPPVVNALAWSAHRQDVLVEKFLMTAREHARLDGGLPVEPDALLDRVHALL